MKYRHCIVSKNSTTVRFLVLVAVVQLFVLVSLAVHALLESSNVEVVGTV